MKRFLTLFFALFLLHSFAQTRTTITAVSGGSAKIEPVTLPKGTSGIVIHSFDADHSTIVARAILTSSDTVAFSTYEALAQPNLPKPKILPQKGDTVILGYLYDRALVIAPNYEAYEKIVSSKDLEWIHPDLFAAELAKAHHPAPSRKDFRRFCDKFALAKVIVALKDEGVVLDCYSFASLERFPLNYNKSALKLPFYSRVEKIESSLFDFFASSKIENYYDYYTKLVEGR